MEGGKKEEKVKVDENADSEQEQEGKLKYIKRKEDDGKKEDAKEKEGKEVENDNKAGGKDKVPGSPAEEENPAPKDKPKSLAHEIEASMNDQNTVTEPDDPSGFHERRLQKKSFTFWSLDLWLRDYLSEWNPIVPYIIEILVVGIILFLPSIFWIIKEWKSLNIKKYFDSPGPLKYGEIESLFRFALFTFLWYSFDMLAMVFCSAFLTIMNGILYVLQLNESEFIWSVLISVYSLKAYVRISATCYFVYYLTKIMFSEFVKPKSFDILDINTYKVLIHWAAIYSGLHFIAMLILNICIYDIKRSSYKDAIWGLNYKIFIFKKMEEIANAPNAGERDRICKEMVPSYDPGFCLKDTGFFLSDEDAKIVANNILVSLKKKKLELADIKKYFPDDYEQVFAYFSGVDITEENAIITATAFIKRAKELFLKRKDMLKTLIDRDYIFDMLESLVSLVVLYVAAIVLCLLFDIEYKLYLFGFGSSLLTFSWVFADTIKKIFICFIFVLLIKPYDIGDRVVISNDDLRVHKINLLHTTFLNKNRSVVYHSNDVLFNTPILNYARSPYQTIEIEIVPENVVTLQQVKKIEENALEKVKNIPKHFISLEISEKSESKIRFMVYLKNNLQDDITLKNRKNILMKLFDKALTEVGVPHKNSYIFTPLL